MSDSHWHPVNELVTVAGGWRMPRTRHGNAEGAITDSAGELTVWIREGDLATPIGTTYSLHVAAAAIWRWGREDLWPSRIALRPL